MKDILTKTLIFTAGAAIGSLVTWKICKTRYEAIVQEELDSIKETFSVRILEDEDVEDILDEEPEESEEQPLRHVSNKPDLQEYAKLIAEYREELDKDEIDELEETSGGIYPIKPESFGDDDYDTQYLTLYADDVLADAQDFPIEDVKGAVGIHFREHFGLYEHDLVCIRNEDRKTDYEICRDDRKYSEIYSTDKREVDDE